MLANLLEIKTDKLDWGYGLRVVVILFVSYIVLGQLGLGKYWFGLTLGALLVAASDQITLPIGYRVLRLGSITLVGVLLTFLGQVLGVNWELAVLGTFLVTLLCGASLAWGQPAALATYFLNIWFLVALFLPGGVAQAWPYALAWLIGGGCYTLLVAVGYKRSPSTPEPAQGTAPVWSPGPLFATYFALFRFTSPQFRFVLLKALAVTIGTVIALGFHLPHADWVPLFTLVVFQPDLEQTLNIFVPRLVGTILGATLAAVLLSSVHNKDLLALVIIVSAFIAYTMIKANLLIYMFFYTTELLLLIDLPTPGSLTDVWARVVNVFIGALIAVVVVFLFLRPSQKKESSSAASG